MLGQCRTSMRWSFGMNSIRASTPSSVVPLLPAMQMLSSLNASPRNAAHCAMKNKLMSVTVRTPLRREKGHAPMSRCRSSEQHRAAHITPSSLTRHPLRFSSCSVCAHWLRQTTAMRASSTPGHHRRSSIFKLSIPQHISIAIGRVRACSSLLSRRISIPLTREAPDAHSAVQFTCTAPLRSASLSCPWEFLAIAWNASAVSRGRSSLGRNDCFHNDGVPLEVFFHVTQTAWHRKSCSIGSWAKTWSRTISKQ
mmetsp:Transcript_59894/g.122921  ORF Transcript_59894/g.122921 Transcript_59894/m.122921 type:complete len:253 (-) Transcript_59894:176-934(-)